jgi:hypothetical protein
MIPQKARSNERAFHIQNICAHARIGQHTRVFTNKIRFFPFKRLTYTLRCVIISTVIVKEYPKKMKENQIIGAIFSQKQYNKGETERRNKCIKRNSYLI